MVVSLLCGVMLAQASAKEIEPKIVAVSMFKNGYTLVARQFPVSGSGVYEVVDIPQVVFGTFWTLGTDGMKVDRILAGSREKVVNVPAASLDQVLALNIGKTVTVDFHDLPSLTGVLKAVNGDYLVLEVEGQSHVTHRNRVKRFSVAGGAVWSQDQKVTQRVLQYTVNAPRAGTLTTFSIERGMAWSPSYRMDLSEANSVEVSARATVINDLADLNGAISSLITGFPNLRFSYIMDPLTSPGSLDDLLRQFAMQSGAAPGPAVANQMARYEADRGAAMAPPPIEMGEGQLEDLFFYRGPTLDLKKGDRSNFELFSFKSPCEHIYTWTVDRSRYNTELPQETWHAIKFKNNAGQPLTTGAATAIASNQVLAQDMLNYVSKNGMAELTLTKALDVPGTAKEEETDRQRQNYKVYNTMYDLVTVKGTLEMTNRKPETIKARVRHSFVGELKSAELSPRVAKLPMPQAQINPVTNLEWTFDLGPGQTRKIEYVYTMYVPSGGY